jgi:SNF2 family DNA or RNA helicase
VTIYKLVTEGTVDEDIYEIGERKSQLSHALLSSNGSKKNKEKGEGEEDVHLISQILSKALTRRL